MKLFVVILHFGDIVITKNCIDSLEKNDKFSKTIVIVNNTNQDITREFHKKLIIINNKKNLGFAKGVNKGIAYAMNHKASHVLLLNNDTIITKPLTKKLVEEIDNGNTGIVGPAITFKKKNKTLFDIGGKINKFFWRTSHEEVLKIKNKKTETVDYVSGCCMLIKREVFKKIGFFDEQFFLYYEDADFCLRAKNAGFTTMIVPSVTIKHSLSASKGTISPFTVYYLMQSGILFGRKYAKSFIEKTANRFFLLTQAALFAKANPSALSAISKALLN